MVDNSLHLVLPQSHKSWFGGLEWNLLSQLYNTLATQHAYTSGKVIGFVQWL